MSTTTGISAAERSITAMKCVDPEAKPEDFRRPGHMFPLLAKDNGVLERNGHTEATVDLMRLAGLKEVGLCCEIMREDGTMMRAPELQEKSKEWGLKFIHAPGGPRHRPHQQAAGLRATGAGDGHHGGQPGPWAVPGTCGSTTSAPRFSGTWGQKPCAC